MPKIGKLLWFNTPVRERKKYAPKSMDLATGRTVLPMA